jgi:hypothetical protein
MPPKRTRSEEQDRAPEGPKRIKTENLEEAERENRAAIAQLESVEDMLRIEDRLTQNPNAWRGSTPPSLQRFQPQEPGPLPIDPLTRDDANIQERERTERLLGRLETQRREINERMGEERRRQNQRNMAARLEPVRAAADSIGSNMGIPFQRARVGAEVLSGAASGMASDGMRLAERLVRSVGAQTAHRLIMLVPFIDPNQGSAGLYQDLQNYADSVSDQIRRRDSRPNNSLEDQQGGTRRRSARRSVRRSARRSVRRSARRSVRGSARRSVRRSARRSVRRSVRR